MKLTIKDNYDEESYSVYMVCTNCGNCNEYFLPIGTPITKKIKEESKCYYCECVGYLEKESNNIDELLIKRVEFDKEYLKLKEDEINTKLYNFNNSVGNN